ncbi:RAMP superfamily CRISPR-associated protein [uncultured Propionibacterium sp.]|uniref:RAMP superfamily CRISPR-associated protein n=1 Tax=uncultured Propionibacterium sp. TaxID=218066 RepID=UPI00292D94AF|nr:RAMP superfamily CRISPR-associated protein [uncultured Propionibacterium sp.]
MRTRYELTVHLRTASPMHSGGVDAPVDRSRNADERMTEPRGFARDGHGDPVLTGRSVKGALRAACEQQLRNGDAAGLARGDLRKLWGDQDHAAALTFHPIRLGQVAASGEPGPSTGPRPLGTRTGIAVDRYWGTAADTALFAHEYLPAGVGLELTVTAQAGPPDDGSPDAGAAASPEQVERLFRLILGLLKDGRVGFGGRRNAGWGRVELDGDRAWNLTRSELGSREGLMAWLGGGQDITDQFAPVGCGAGERVRISIEWRSPSGILVAEPRGAGDAGPADAENTAPAEADTADRGADPGGEETEPARPLRCGPGENDLLVLPGSSVRGALRSRASRIARTVLAARRGVRNWSETGVHDQLADDPVLVRDLFGSTEHRGALTVLDTLAAGPGPCRKVTHNAGDRWTGGVAEGALYSEEVHDVAWNSIELELDPGMFPGGTGPDRHRAAWCLLGLTLAELATGTLPLGSRGARGMGQVTVTRLRVEGGRQIVGGPWDFTASGPGDTESIAARVLESLRTLAIGKNPDVADEDWTGWSTHLIEAEERTNG